MGGDIPGTYAPFSYSVLIVAIEGPAGYVVLGIGDEDVFRIGMDHDPYGIRMSFSLPSVIKFVLITSLVRTSMIPYEMLLLCVFTFHSVL